MEELKQMVLKEFKPTKEELLEINRVEEHTLDILFDVLAEHGIKYETMMSVGSYAKETMLKGSSDLDIFVSFPLDTDEELFKGLIKEAFIIAGHRLDGNPKVNYASHPYVMLNVDGVDVDIVPCYEIENINEMKSPVDRTPLHTTYMWNNLSSKQKDDVIVLKRFMKNNGLYGANESVHGFSGYLCECLIDYYGDFETVLESELEDFRVAECHIEYPIEFIDPVDPDRNVAAALSPQKYGEFVTKSREFIISFDKENPLRLYPEFFDTPFKKVSKEDIKKLTDKRGTWPIIIDKKIEDNKEKEFSSFAKQIRNDIKQLQENGFNVIKSKIFEIDDYVIAIIDLERHNPIPLVIKQGPPLQMEDACLRFMAANEEYFVDGAKLCANSYRDKLSIEDFIRNQDWVITYLDYRLYGDCGEGMFNPKQWHQLTTTLYEFFGGK